MPVRTINLAAILLAIVPLAACGKREEPIVQKERPPLTAQEKRVKVYTRCLVDANVWYNDETTKKHCLELAKDDK